MSAHGPAQMVLRHLRGVGAGGAGDRGGGRGRAWAGCMAAFPEKPGADAEPWPLAKRLAGNFGVTIAGEEYLLNLHPAG